MHTCPLRGSRAASLFGENDDGTCEGVKILYIVPASGRRQEPAFLRWLGWCSFLQCWSTCFCLPQAW